jgi:hypothetical protein
MPLAQHNTGTLRSANNLCCPCVPFLSPLLLPAPQLTHNSYHLSFELPGGASANMPVASCLLTKALLQGPGDDKPKVVVRPYTPVSKPDAAGHLDLVIKAYPAGWWLWVWEQRRCSPMVGREICSSRGSASAGLCTASRQSAAPGCSHHHHQQQQRQTPSFQPAV